MLSSLGDGLDSPNGFDGSAPPSYTDAVACTISPSQNATENLCLRCRQGLDEACSSSIYVLEPAISYFPAHRDLATNSRQQRVQAKDAAVMNAMHVQIANFLYEFSQTTLSFAKLTLFPDFERSAAATLWDEDLQASDTFYRTYALQPGEGDGEKESGYWTDELVFQRLAEALKNTLIIRAMKCRQSESLISKSPPENKTQEVTMNVTEKTVVFRTVNVFGLYNSHRTRALVIEVVVNTSPSARGG